MTEDVNRYVGLGHNKGPVTPPSETDFLDDLKRRYPEVETELAGFEAAFNAAPTVIEDDTTAGQVSDLYLKVNKAKGTWKSWRGTEKGPWDRLAKVAMNFFKGPEDKADIITVALKERLTGYTEKKAEEARKEAAARAEIERKEGERLRAEAEAAEQRKRDAEEAERQAKAREEAARVAEEEAKERRRKADEAAAAAKAEHDRLENERRDREAAEKAQNIDGIKLAKGLMKEAEELHRAADANPEAPLDPRLEEITRPSGALSDVLRPVVASHLLSQDQSDTLDVLRGRVTEIRAAITAWVDAKGRKRREKERRDQEDRDRVAAEERRLRREADEAAAAKAKKDREEAEAEAARAKADAREAHNGLRAAQDDQDEASREQRQAEREGSQIGKQAGKVERRAERLSDKASGASDADLSRSRGDYSVASGTRRWTWRYKDRNATVAKLGILGPYIHPDAIDAAVTKYMRQNQGEWGNHKASEFFEDPAVPGVIFEYVPDARVA